jgi:hypothetical protein
MHDVIKTGLFYSENLDEQFFAVLVVNAKPNDLPENSWRVPDTAVMPYPLLATSVRD